MYMLKIGLWSGALGLVLDILGSGLVGGGSSSFTLTKWCFFIGLAIENQYHTNIIYGSKYF